MRKVKIDKDRGIIVTPFCNIICHGKFAFNVVAQLLADKAIKIEKVHESKVLAGTEPRWLVYDELVNTDEKHWKVIMGNLNKEKA